MDQNQWRMSQTAVTNGMQAEDAIFLRDNLIEFECFSSLDSERIEQLKDQALSSECPELLRLSLLQALYYDDLVPQLTLEHLESYLSALAALPHSGRYLYTAKGLFPVLVCEVGIDLQEVRQRLEGRFSEEIQLSLLANLVLANRLDFAELGELSDKAKSKAAAWARSAAMWHALILARPLVPIWAELPPYSYNSLETALEDWAYAEEGSTQPLLDLGAISPRESEIFLEFGRALNSLLRSYSGSLEDAWFTAPECAAIRAIIEKVFVGQDSLACIYGLNTLR